MKSKNYFRLFLILCVFGFANTAQAKIPGLWFGIRGNSVSMSKTVTRDNASDQTGNFRNKTDYGFAFGYRFDFPINIELNYVDGIMYQKKEYAEYSVISGHAEYDVEFTQSTALILGVFYGYATFNLIVGPEIDDTSATLYETNPKAAGAVYGPSIGLRLLTRPYYMLSLRYDHGVSDFKETIKDNPGLNDIEVSDYSNFSIMFALGF